MAANFSPTYTYAMSTGYHALSEKEKQTLRLLGNGYDAKSMARHLGLSVHTVNERLRDARRKMSTSSSREAARQLRSVEEADPQLFGDKGFGDAAAPGAAQVFHQPVEDLGNLRRISWIVGGSVMTISLALLALSALSGGTDAPAAATPATSSAQSPAAGAALQWLALVDGEDWNGAWAETGQSFRRNNTVKVWTAAATGVRARYGATSGRSLISSEWVPAPPNGYWIVKFRTTTSKQGVITETLSLAEEAGTWKVVGIMIE